MFKWNGEQESLSLSVIGGLETPTGETHARDKGTRLSPSLQPGLGGWNPFVALAGIPPPSGMSRSTTWCPCARTCTAPRSS